MKEVVPGGLQHNLGLVNPFALAFERATGYKIYDINGNEYIELCSGFSLTK